MSRSEGAPAGDSFNVNARAKGHGDVRVVVQGTQQNIHNHYYGEAGGEAGPVRPFDLPGLRLWIDRIVADYRQQLTAGAGEPAGKEAAGQLRQLDELRRSVEDPAGNGGGKNALRRLLASGIAQYLSRAGQVPAGQVPEQLLVDLLVFALWAVLEAPGLPGTWQQDLVELTSPRVAALTVAARDAKDAGRPVPVEEFTSVLSARPVGPALHNLLDDLSEPRRGGSALTALAVAAGLPAPPGRGGAKAMATWMIAVLAGATAGGAVGVIEGHVGGLLDPASSPASHPSGGHGHHPDLHHPDLHHHGHGHGHGSLLEMILDLL